MANIFKLDQVVSKNKYNKGIATTQRFDVVDLGKPGADDWFKLYTFTEQGLDNFPPVMICKTKDPEGKLNPYLIGGSEDFKAACAEKLPRIQDVHLAYGITPHKRLLIWPVVYLEDLKTNSKASTQLKKQSGEYFDIAGSYAFSLDKRDQKFRTTEGHKAYFSQALPLISDDGTLINTFEYNL